MLIYWRFKRNLKRTKKQERMLIFTVIQIFISDSDCEEDIPRIDLAEMMEMVDLNKNDEEMPDLEG